MNTSNSRLYSQMEIKGFNNKKTEQPKKVEKKQPKKSLVDRVMETFFLNSLPEQQDGYVQINRTTKEIQDELEPMMLITQKELNTYLDKHGYKLVADKDGSVKWAIWRII